MRRYHIALTDDDEDDIEIFETAIRGMKFDVYLAVYRDGEALLQSLFESNAVWPDLIFLDINMPFIDGFECLRRIRNSSAHSGQCVIVYSTSGRSEDIRRAYELKANCFIQKPSNIENLKRILRGIVTREWNDPCEILAEENFVLTA